MRPTSLAGLVFAGLAAAPAGWLLAWLTLGWTNQLLPVPWLLPALLLFLVLVLLGAERAVREWVRERRRDRSVTPLRVARALAAAKATAMFGALGVGAYTGVALVAWSVLDQPAGPGRLLAAAAVVLTCCGLVVAGLRLERACRVPGEDDDDGPDAPGGGGGSPGVAARTAVSAPLRCAHVLVASPPGH